MENFDELLLNLYRQFANSLNFVILSAIVIFLICSWYYIAYFFLALKSQKKFPKGKINYKYAVLIPARNEDKVIKKCLDSLKKQDYPKDLYKVFVIVESKDDPTCKIVKKYGSNFITIIRKNLINRRTKGYALDEAYQYIKENNMIFDAFMVFDADNIISSNYISLMNDCKNQGYKVGTGYRNFTNATTNWVTGCSATLFSFMNNYTSYGRSQLFKKCTLTGTGYFVDFDIIDNEKGWIFNGFTEDVELTYYCYHHNVPMFYYKEAKYFDEQSSKMSVVHKQHIRWLFGFFKNKKKFKEKTYDYGSNKPIRKFFSLWEFTLGIYPFVFLCIIEFLCFLIGFALFISSLITAALPKYNYFISENIPAFTFWNVTISFLYLFLTFVFIVVLTYIIDNKNLKFTFGKMLINACTYLFFMGDFAVAFLDGLFHKKKRINWEKIEHTGEVLDKQALGVMNEKKKR